MKPVLLFLTTVVAAGALQTPSTFAPSADDTRAIEKKLSDLSARVTALRAQKADPALVADVDVYRRAAELILRFAEEFATKAFVADTQAVIDTGVTRARELEAGAPSWPKRKGHVIRALPHPLIGVIANRSADRLNADILTAVPHRIYV